MLHILSRGVGSPVISNNNNNGSNNQWINHKRAPPLPTRSTSKNSSNKRRWVVIAGREPVLFQSSVAGVVTTSRIKSNRIRKIIEQDCISGTDISPEDGDSPRKRSLSECYFAVKGAALVLPQAEVIGLRLPIVGGTTSITTDDIENVTNTKEATGHTGNKDIQRHLQAMFQLLRVEDTLKMAVKLESAHPGRTRYLAVVSCVPGNRQGSAEESCLLGIDSNEITTIGLVLRLLAHTVVTLDGDGGFSVKSCDRQHIFKPVSVQAMWSAIQTLHKANFKAQESKLFMGGLNHQWVEHYERNITSEQSCLNEWNAMDNLVSRRPPSPDSIRNKPTAKDETERVIRTKLKEIMTSVDLDEVTSKYIRGRLEEDLALDLGEFKSFIDEEMLTILGQMDAATMVFEHVFLGSEWNASNLEELKKNGIGHILNVTREIDNFFPGNFEYMNIRVYDDETTELLKHWDNTFRYINKARLDGSKVLVHCKMGVSRSASVVIAYAMKAFDWNLSQALEHVRKKRSCVKPNTNFMRQLEIYQGMLMAMKNREKLQRSRSETNLKSPGLVNKADKAKPPKPHRMNHKERNSSSSSGCSTKGDLLGLMDGGFYGGGGNGERPKSWSPDDRTADFLFPEDFSAHSSVSAEHLHTESSSPIPPYISSLDNSPTPPKLPLFPGRDNLLEEQNINHLRIPCSNGQTYSVTQNQVLNISCPSCETLDVLSDDEQGLIECFNLLVNYVDVSDALSGGTSSVKERVNELESSQQSQLPVPKKSSRDPERRGLVLNLATQFESVSKPNSPEEEISENEIEEPVLSQTKLPPQKHQAVIVKQELWDCDKEPADVPKEAKTSPPLRKEDPFSVQVDKVFEREERKQQRSSVIPTIIDTIPRDCPSRENSWGSYDSAVGLSTQGGCDGDERPSRQSSWSSCDMRQYNTLPSRNSSWGSYDVREPKIDSDDNSFTYERECIPWTPGTVRRTKVILEEKTSNQARTPEEMVNIVSESPPKFQTGSIAYKPTPETTHYSSSPILYHRKPEDPIRPPEKLTVSQPNIPTYPLTFQTTENQDTLNTAVSLHDLTPIPFPKSFSEIIVDLPSPTVDESPLPTSVRKQKEVLESNIMQPKPDKTVQRLSLHENPTRTFSEFLSDKSSHSTGVVRSLKQNFEAKSTVPSIATATITKEKCADKTPSSPTKDIRSSSLPSSPLELPLLCLTEDIAVPVREMVGKFEVAPKRHHTISENNPSPCLRKDSQGTPPNIPPRRSSLDSSVRRSIQKTNETFLLSFEQKNRHSVNKRLERNNSTNETNNSTLARTSGINSIGKPPPAIKSITTSASNLICSKVKKQQGKSHPLSKIGKRHTNPLYNTM